MAIVGVRAPNDKSCSASCASIYHTAVKVDFEVTSMRWAPGRWPSEGMQYMLQESQVSLAVKHFLTEITFNTLAACIVIFRNVILDGDFCSWTPSHSMPPTHGLQYMQG